MPPGLGQAFPAFVTLTNALVNPSETLLFSLVLFEYPLFQYPQKTQGRTFTVSCPKLNTIS